MICKVANEVTGKDSVLHKKLLDIFKDEAQTDLYYSKIIGSEFAAEFGDWKKKGRSNGKDKTVIGEVTEDLEPKLFKHRDKNSWYFKLADGTILPIKGIAPLRKDFSPTEVKEITAYFLYRFVQEGGFSDFNNLEANKNESKILASINRSIESYRADISQLEGVEEWAEDLAELQAKIDKVAAYSNEFKEELVYRLDTLGKRIREDLVDGEGNSLEDVSDEDKSNALNIAEAMTVNPKNTATVNTKLFLAQLVETELDIDGNLDIKDTGYLQTPSFVEFSEVWETLQPLLADLTTTGKDDNNLVSAYTKMSNAIKSLYNVNDPSKDIKSWARDLDNKLTELYNDNKNGRSKVFEFVQAFNKNKINYYVNEFNEDTGRYTVINATATNSRESQILDRWGEAFREEYLQSDTQIYLTESDRDTLEGIRENIDEIRKNWLFGGRPENAAELTFAALISELEDVGMYGLDVRDLNALILETGGMDNLEDTMDKLLTAAEYTLNDMTQDERKFTGENGDSLNLFRQQKYLKLLAKSAAYRELNIAESNILSSDGKSLFAYSNPTHIANKISQWKSDPTELQEMASLTINESSRWAKWLLGTHDSKGNLIKRDKERKRLSEERLDKLEQGIASSLTTKGKSNGVDNVHISLTDQLNDNISKVLAGKIGGQSMFPSIIAADKTRRVEFKGLPFEHSGIHNRDGGKAVIHKDTVKIFVNYFMDEYNRMKDVSKENDNLADYQKIQYYHGADGNGLKSQVFPEFNHDNTDPKWEFLRNVLYENGLPLATGMKGFSPDQVTAVEQAIEMSLRERLNETYLKVKEINDTSMLDSALVAAYKEEGGLVALAGDYLVNGLISTIEYTKIFSGDPAYYKNLPDLIKRIPATYTDGLQLALESADDMVFNTAIVQGVEVASQYVSKIKESLTDKSIANAYDRVNTTDAQAWITPRRWKFLKKRLGQWGDQHDAVYDAMLTGKMLKGDQLKLAAQPLKGVYFEINNGVPTYLKYSQAVLIPAMVKGTPMQGLLDQMAGKLVNGKFEKPIKEEVHEVITEDGIKVGAIAPTQINVPGTTEMRTDIQLNVHQMSNRGWKLQQDLPVKTMHETNLGSQIQKNILDGLKLDKNYLVAGERQKGKMLLSQIHAAIGDLVNLGRQDVNEKLGIDSEGKINDTSSLYNVLLKEFRSRGGSENIIQALERQTPFDSIPQIRGRVDSILMGVFNKAMIKISTEGGSFIQVSPFGYETLEGEVVEGGLTVEEARELEELQSKAETSDGNMYLTILNAIPKITPESAKKEIGGDVGVKKDINPSWLSKDGVSIEKASEDIWADNFSESGEIEEAEIRNVIIEFLQQTKTEARANMGGDASRIKELLAKQATQKYVKTKNKSNVKIISDRYDGKGLQPPRKGPDGQTLPGQCMIPHTLAVKLLQQSGLSANKIRNFDWANAFKDPKVRELVGYRIPNQGMSSNDTLEIVGILPETMGDSIMAYDAIPAKTGSDFDIDKMFIIAPNLVLNKGKFEFVTNRNKNLMARKKTENDSQYLRKTAKAVAQNRLLSLYSAVLQSPHTYDNMMTSIDADNLKEDIVGKKNPETGEVEGGLFPEPAAKNLDIFSPVKQLETKMNYMSGKMGVALTANQLVDHVANQSLDIYVKGELGVGQLARWRGETAVYTKMDIAEGITSTLSAFLNAYVDIAKDPYVSRANHNDVTANISFMLIRAGASLKWINRYIGQPILKEYVDLIKRSESITAKPLRIKDKDGIEKEVSPKEYIMIKYDMKEDLYPLKKLSKLKEGDFESRIKGEENPELDSTVFQAFVEHEGKAAQWTDAVLAAKVDVKGGGSSPITVQTSINKVDKIENAGFVRNYWKKFADTALESYMSSVYYMDSVLRKNEILLSGTSSAKVLRDSVSAALTKNTLLVNDKLGQAVDNNMYSYLMAGTDLFKDNRLDFDNLFRKLPETINALKEAQANDTDPNFLIQELEVVQKNGIKFIGINSRNKPAEYENDIHRAWLNLYDNPDTKILAKELAQYAYSQSGFQHNLNQFFTLIPNEILREEGVHQAVTGFGQKLSDLSSARYTFLDQMYRHEATNHKVVPRMGEKMFKWTESGLLGGVVPSEAMYERFKTYEGGNEQYYLPDFISINIGGEYGVGLYQKHSSNGVDYYLRTFKMGMKAGKNKVFEYAYDQQIKKSIIAENNLTLEERQLVQKTKEEILALPEMQAEEKESVKAIQESVSNSLDVGEPWSGEADNRKQEYIALQAQEDADLQAALNFDHEERAGKGSDYTSEDLSVFWQKVQRLKETMDVDVILSESVPTSRVLSKNDPRTKKAGKPVILINPKAVFKTTAIHEFGHIFIDSLPGGINNPRMQRALKLLKDTPLEAEVKALYPDLNAEQFAKELVTTAIGRKGSDIWDNTQDVSAWQSIVNWFKDFIRRTFGIKEDAITSLTKELLSDSVKKNLTQDLSTTEQEERTDKGEKEDSELSSALESLESTYKETLTRVTNIYNEYLPSTNEERYAESIKRESGTTRFESVETLKAQLEKLASTDKKRGLIKYIQWADGEIDEVIKRTNIRKKSGTLNDKRIISSIEWNQGFSMLKDINDLIMQLEDEGEVTAAETRLFSRKIEKMQGKRSKLEDKLLRAAREVYADFIADNDNQVRAEWQASFEKEYDDLKVSTSGKSKEQYVKEKLTESVQLIRDEAKKKALKQAKESVSDISQLAATMWSEKNANSKDIQVLSGLVDRIEREIQAFALFKATQFDDMNKEYREEVGNNINQKKKYKGLVSESSSGMSYYTGEYNPDFLEKKNELMKAVFDIDAAIAKYAGIKVTGDKLEYMIENEKGNPEKRLLRFGNAIKYKVETNEDGNSTHVSYEEYGERIYIPTEEAIARSEYEIWVENNTEIHVDNNHNEKYLPKEKWLSNEYKSLNDKQKKHLEWLKKQVREADELFEHKNSLVKETFGAEFISLPGVLKSDRQRIAQGDVVGALKHQLSELTAVQKDDWETQEGTGRTRTDAIKVFADISNKEKLRVPIPFRAKLNSKEQSLDLHTITLMNTVAAKNYQKKKEVEATFLTVLEVMKNRNVPASHGIMGFKKLHATSVDDALIYKDLRDGLPNDAKKALDILENRIYGIKSKDAGKIKLGKKELDINTAAKSWLKYSGMTALVGNFANSIVNLSMGSINNLIEASSGEHYNMKDWIVAGKKYWKDVRHIKNDWGSNVDRSRTNLFMMAFNVMGNKEYLDNKFEESTKSETLLKVNSLRPLAKAGEHMMQAKVMYAVMNHMKVMNADGKFIDKEGNVVSKNKAASLDEMLEFVPNKFGGGVSMKLNDLVQSTTHTLTGGPELILNEAKNLIKYKVRELHGNYDSDIQAAAQREFWGKMIFFLRKWVEEGYFRRWRGTGKMFKKHEDLKDSDRFYSQDAKGIREGYYVTAIRFFSRTLIPAVAKLNFSLIKENSSKLSGHEIGNLKKMITELSILTLTYLAYAVLDGDDEEELYTKYVFRRMLSETAFYMAPTEGLKIVQTPTASVGTLRRIMSVFTQAVTNGANWEDETYKNGVHKERSKLWVKILKAFPVTSQTEKEIKAQLDYLNTAAGF